MLACKYHPEGSPETSWIRGLVVRPSKPHAFYVFYVDYGTEEEVFFDDAKKLDPKFEVLPHQAIRARLSGLQSKSGGKCITYTNHTLQCAKNLLIVKKNSPKRNSIKNHTYRAV